MTRIKSLKRYAEETFNGTKLKRKPIIGNPLWSQAVLHVLKGTKFDHHLRFNSEFFISNSNDPLCKD